MAYTYSDDIVSDLHKDARGFRPNEYFWEEWTQAPADIKQQIWDNLIVEFNETMERQRQAENEAMIALHQRIQGLMLIGAKDEVQAIKWLIEAEEFDDYDLRYGSSYFCFHFNLPYSADKEFPIKEAINEMLAEVV